MDQKKFSAKNVGIAVLLAALSVSSASAQAVNLVQNGSFETTDWTGNRAQHGYVVHNGKVNGSIPNWMASSDAYGYGTTLKTEEFGKNTGDFDGDYALFIQRSGTLSQTITGLVPGELYTYSFRYDARNAHKESTILAKAGDLTLLNNVKYSTRNPFYDYEVTFRATEETMDISFANTHGNSDTSVLVDKVQLVESAADDPWTCSGTTDLWLSDATIGVDSSNIYTHTLNFGSAVTNNALVNGVPFAKVAGKGTTDFYSIPAANVYGKADSALQTIFGAANTGSQEMAKDFFYGVSGVTLTGLEPGVQYTTTFYLASWDTTNRTGFITAPDGTRFGLNENKLRTESNGRAGGLVKWTGRASEDGTLSFSFAHSSETLHIYGLTNEVTQGQTPETSGTNLLLATNFGGPNGNGYNGMAISNTAADVVNFISPAGSEKWQLRGLHDAASLAQYTFVENGALHTGANCMSMMDIDTSLLAGKWIDISADLKINTLQGNEKPNARGIGIGFSREGVALKTESGVGFSGLVLNPAGDLMFYENANGTAVAEAKISESIKYLSEDGSAFDASEWYELDMTLAFSDDGTTATLLNVGLEGSAADYSALKGLTFETTDLFAILSSSAASWNYYGLVDNVRVSEYVPEPSTWALLVLGSGSLLLLRRRKGQKQTA